jgi:succinoglycan biosynthesis protein ExoV
VKLFYFRHPNGRSNFGDDLNAWIWPKLLPFELNSSDDEIVLIGIGTLLNDVLDQATEGSRARLVFGAGVGYGNGLPKIDKSYKFYCLRGPYSARSLGLSPDVAITDAAILVRTLSEDLKRIQGPQNPQQRFPYSYMPHVSNAGSFWMKVCKAVGIKYIDPRKPTEEILSNILRTNVLITEAMHGAIVSDALRIPWIPVKTTQEINEEKWHDWCSSVSIDYISYRLNLISHPRGIKFIPGGKRIVAKINFEKSYAFLTHVMESSEVFLSADTKIEALTEKIQYRLENLIKDYH